jgi:hypothetical protein
MDYSRSANLRDIELDLQVSPCTEQSVLSAVLDKLAPEFSSHPVQRLTFDQITNKKKK